MNEQMNGQMPQTTAEDQTLMLWTHQALLCTIRGILSCFPQHRAEKVLLIVVLNAARLVSELYAGDEVSVHRFRKACRDMFETTSKQMPVVPLPGQAKAADTATIGSG